MTLTVAESLQPHPPSRFERPREVDPRTRRDESLAFADVEHPWTPPEWFDRVHVVLYETTDVVNIGGVIRAMANAGFERLRLVNPAPFERWDVIGVAHYTQHILDAAPVLADLQHALQDAHLVVGLTGKHHRDQRNARPFAEIVRLVADAAAAGETVILLFGREDTGLPNSALDRCHFVTTIPTNPAHPSLNLAQAVLLTLYPLFQLAQGDQQPLRPPRRTAPPASSALLDDLFADLERSLEAIEFQKMRPRESTLRSLRAILYRTRLDQREASLLRAFAIEIRRFLHRRGVLSDVGEIGRSTAVDADRPGRSNPADTSETGRSGSADTSQSSGGQSSR